VQPANKKIKALHNTIGFGEMVFSSRILKPPFLFLLKQYNQKAFLFISIFLSVFLLYKSSDD
jgi:hypothetical protein